MDDQQHDEGDQGAEEQVDVERSLNRADRPVFFLDDEQIPFELGNVAHIEEVVLPPAQVFESAFARFQDGAGLIAQAFDFMDAGARRIVPAGPVFPRHNDVAAGIDQIDAASIALLIAVDHVADRVNRQADAGCPDEVLVVVEYPVIDEDGQLVAVGQVGIDVDFVGLAHVANTKIPGIARLFRTNRLQRTPSLVVGAGFFGNKKGRHRAVVRHHFLEVARHLPDVAFSGHHPFAQEGIARHHRGDQNRANQILLDLGINVVRGQWQFGRDNRFADRVPRDEVTDQRGCHESGTEQQPQGRDQLALVIQYGGDFHDRAFRQFPASG